MQLSRRAIRHILQIRRQSHRLRQRRCSGRATVRIPPIPHPGRSRDISPEDSETGHGREAGLQERAAGQRHERQGLPHIRRRRDEHGGGKTRRRIDHEHLEQSTVRRLAQAIALLATLANFQYPLAVDDRPQLCFLILMHPPWLERLGTLMLHNSFLTCPGSRLIRPLSLRCGSSDIPSSPNPSLDQWRMSSNTVVQHQSMLFALSCRKSCNDISRAPRWIG